MFKWKWCPALALFAILAPLQASAHPLGNFSINHVTIVHSRSGALQLRFVLDIAEIPSFQIMHARGATWSASDRVRWIESENRSVLSQLDVDIDRQRAQLKSIRDGASTRPGAGGLPTLYWVGDYSVQLPPGAHHIAITDGVYADRATGWKDIAVGLHRDVTNELRNYPSDLLSSPRHITAVSFSIAENGMMAGESLVAEDQGRSPVSLTRSNALMNLFAQRDRAPGFILLTLAVAFVLGALHAIEPGHGKALLAFTLVGSRASVRQAVILALSLTFAHTIGVVLLGVALFFLSGFVAESIYPWIALLSGVAVAIIGARLFAIAARRRIGSAAHEHGDGDHAHHHGDGDFSHSHVIPGTEPIRFGNAIAAAMTGGIAPCPAAIVVMLAALRMHEVGYGLIVIVVFSLGLASVLSIFGLAVVFGTGLLKERRELSWLIAQGPLVSASLISVIGAVMVGQGFVEQGIHVSSWLIAGLVLVAIASYGATAQFHSHQHGAASA